MEGHIHHLSELIISLGVLTLACIIFQVLTGPHILKVKFTFHKVIGFVTLILAATHAALNVYVQFFME